MSPAAVHDAVRRAAHRAGLPDAATYTAHSLRAGGATAAYRAGAPVAAITRHGRWADNSPTVLSYLRAVDRWTDNPLADVGL
jgi:integrase